jgi:hypothetical protein
MLFRAEEAIFKGYKAVGDITDLADLKFPKGFFQIRLPDASYIVVGREHLKQMFAAPEKDLSLAHSIGDRMQIRYTFDESITLNQYHVPIVRTELTRHIPEMMSEIMDELGSALDDEIPPTNGT